MDPCIWGPPIWRLLHGTALAAGESCRAAVETTLAAMVHVLPCRKCRTSLRLLRAEIAQIPTGGVFDELWLLHNMVNRKIGKPQMRHGRAVRLWRSMTVPVEALQLADALVLVDGNYAECGDRDKSRAYEQWWEGVAALCEFTPALRGIASLMRRQPRRVCARNSIQRANAVRTSLLGTGSELRHTTRAARAKVRACRKAAT
jgi:hypothetical protein